MKIVAVVVIVMMEQSDVEATFEQMQAQVADSGGNIWTKRRGKIKGYHDVNPPARPYLHADRIVGKGVFGSQKYSTDTPAPIVSTVHVAR